MRERFPFTYTATLPFFGPAVNHMAKDLPFTVKDNAAPVVDVDHTVPPYATLMGAFVHGAETVIACAEVEVMAPAMRSATTASARFEKCITPPYLPDFQIRCHLRKPCAYRARSVCSVRVGHGFSSIH